MPSELENELNEEPSVLSKGLRSVSATVPSGSILVGAGDSYSAALCASHLSRLDSAVLDPYELAASPRLASSRTVLLTSVSGRTRSNIAAARAVRGIAKERIGVTSDGDSPLAKEVDRIILLPFDYRPRSPGMTSFVLSLAFLSRLLAVRLGFDFGRACSASKRISRRLALSGKGSTFFLGNRAFYAVSMYAAAKLYEFFGASARCQRLEEFSHMELFSLRRNDAVNIFGGSDPLKVGRSLARALRAEGYVTGLVPAASRSEAEDVFRAVFATQFAVLSWVRETRTKRPYLLDAKKKLAVSESMIY